MPERTTNDSRIDICSDMAMEHEKAGHKDSDIHKGAVEDDSPGAEHNTSLRGQLGHRNQDEMLKDNDSDYPEPGSSPEHTGERNSGDPAKKK